MRIGIDIDGVLTDIEQWQLDYGGKFFYLENCKKNNIDVMIEDKVKNINNVSRTIPVICFHAGYNKECKGKNIYRVYNWYDIYNLINGGKICKIK